MADLFRHRRRMWKEVSLGFVLDWRFIELMIVPYDLQRLLRECLDLRVGMLHPTSQSSSEHLLPIISSPLQPPRD